MIALLRGARLGLAAIATLVAVSAHAQPTALRATDCPSAELQTSYVLDGDALTQVSQQEQPIEAAQAVTVQALWGGAVHHWLLDSADIVEVQ